MFAKKLGRFTAGLFVALGVCFGGLLVTNAASDGDTAALPAYIAAQAQGDFEWG